MRARSHDGGLAEIMNIGAECAGLLMAAGVRTPAALKRMGSVGAAVRVARIRPEDPLCRSMLAGFEGAIRGVRWHAIPRAERETLWEEYQKRLLKAGRI